MSTIITKVKGATHLQLFDGLESDVLFEIDSEEGYIQLNFRSPIFARAFLNRLRDGKIAGLNLEFDLYGKTD